MLDPILTFVATFSGVILSFGLWFGGEHFIKWREAKKTSKAIMQEIKEEMQFNITFLSQPIRLKSEDVPLLLPKLNHSASGYAISSGELRLIRSRRKQNIVRYMDSACERYNHFLNNTEGLFALLLLRQDGLTWVNYRLVRLEEQRLETKKSLEKLLEKLESRNLPENEESSLKGNHSPTAIA